MDKFYVDIPQMWQLGYQRSIVVQFRQMELVHQNMSYTIATVEQHFYPYQDSMNDTSNFIEKYRKIHQNITRSVHGKMDSSSLWPYDIDLRVSIGCE